MSITTSHRKVVPQGQILLGQIGRTVSTSDLIRMDGLTRDGLNQLDHPGHTKKKERKADKNQDELLTSLSIILCSSRYDRSIAISMSMLII